MRFRRALVLALFVPLSPAPSAAQAPETARFSVSGIAVSLVLSDASARRLRGEAERVIRGGLEEFTEIFNGPPRDAASRSTVP